MEPPEFESGTGPSHDRAYSEQLRQFEAYWGSLSDTVATLSATVLGLSAIFVSNSHVIHPKLLIGCWIMFGAALILSLGGKSFSTVRRRPVIQLRRFMVVVSVICMTIGIAVLVTFAALNLLNDEMNSGTTESALTN